MRATAVSMWIRRASLAMVAGAVVLFLSALPLRAQVDTGAVLGTVTDASGAEVRGATVTLTNEGTNATLSTTTGSSGEYQVHARQYRNLHRQRQLPRVHYHDPAPRRGQRGRRTWSRISLLSRAPSPKPSRSLPRLPSSRPRTPRSAKSSTSATLTTSR